MQLCDIFLATLWLFLGNCPATLCLKGFSKWDKLMIQRTKDCISGKVKDGYFVHITTLQFLILNSKSTCSWEDSTVGCSSVGVVLHKKKDSTNGNFTLQTLMFRSPSYKSTLSSYLASSVLHNGIDHILVKIQ